jgi:SAM-dependent MidA family methyltransferase
LLSDFLRTAKQFPRFYKVLSSGSGIHLLETSSFMRRKQRQALGIHIRDVRYAPSLTEQIQEIIPQTTDADADVKHIAKGIDEYDIRKHAKPLDTHDLYSSKRDARSKQHKIASVTASEDANSIPIEGTIRSTVDNEDMNIQVHWYDVIDDVPHAYQESTASTWTQNADYSTFVLAHEFFDALPIHRFEYRHDIQNSGALSSNGWREHLVDIDETKENPQHLRFVLSNTPTPASKLIMHGKTAASTSTSTLQRGPYVESGTRIEISPVGLKLIEDITYRVGKSNGVALVIDYGSNHSISDSLQAVENHKYAHALSRAGLADLTAHVDFNQLRHAAQRTIDKFQLNARIENLITQHEFLRDMGIGTRINALLEHIQTSDDYLLSKNEEEIIQLCDDIITAGERLVKVDQMGELFKFFAITSNTMKQVPVFTQIDRAKQQQQEPANEPQTACPLR